MAEIANYNTSLHSNIYQHFPHEKYPSLSQKYKYTQLALTHIEAHTLKATGFFLKKSTSVYV